MDVLGLPDTPAGRQARWVVSTWGRMLRKREITARFAPSFLAKISPLKVRAITLSMKALLPVEVTDIGGSDLALRAGLRTAQGPMTLSVTVDPAEPHLIVGLAVRPAGPGVAETLRDAPPSRDVGALVEEHAGAYAATVRGAAAGIACAVVHDGATTVRAFGAVPPDAIFEIGSITKPVTATLLAELCAAGAVGLEDPVARYLPDGARMPAGGEDVTLLELATHTSGLPRLPVNLEVDDEDDPYATFTIETLFAGLARTPLESRGTAAYSNLGYALLGQVLARAMDAPYEDLARDHVLRAYGMADAEVGPEPSRHARRVPGHADGAEVPHWRRAAVTPAGGVEATATDVVTFAARHAGAPAGSAAALTHERRAPFGDGRHVGLAWVIEPTDRGDVLCHDGGTGGFQSFTAFHRATGTAVAILANAQGGAGPHVAASAILGSLVAASAR